MPQRHQDISFQREASGVFQEWGSHLNVPEGLDPPPCQFIVKVCLFKPNCIHMEGFQVWY